jgi:hypothetical protein
MLNRNNTAHLRLCPLPRRRRCPFLTGRSVVVDGAWNGPNPPTSAVRWRTRAPRASGCGRFRRWIGFQFRTDVLCRGGRRQDGFGSERRTPQHCCYSHTRCSLKCFGIVRLLIWLFFVTGKHDSTTRGIPSLHRRPWQQAAAASSRSPLLDASGVASMTSSALWAPWPTCHRRGRGGACAAV